MVQANPRYSICMCNYNMADTLERSLTSILDQLDERFEVVIVDDGSSDSSVNVIKRLQRQYPSLKLCELKRDPKRKLGFTRNISVREAQGEYVLLHLDCDDVYGPFLKDFVEVFHRIEKAVGKDILLSGQHVNMGKRQFLMKHGPYRNMYRGEDRDLWVRLAAIEAYIPLDHVDFVTRLPKRNRATAVHKIMYDTWDHVTNYFRTGASISAFMKYESKNFKTISWQFRLFRLAIMVPAYLNAKFREPLAEPIEIKKPEQLIEYRQRHKGTYPRIMTRFGCDPDLTFLRPAARNIFEK